MSLMRAARATRHSLSRRIGVGVGFLNKKATLKKIEPWQIDLPFDLDDEHTRVKFRHAFDYTLITELLRVPLIGIVSSTLRGRHSMLAGAVFNALQSGQSSLFIEFPMGNVEWSIALGLPLTDGDLAADWLIKVSLGKTGSGRSVLGFNTEVYLAKDGALVNASTHAAVQTAVAVAAKSAWSISMDDQQSTPECVETNTGTVPTYMSLQTSLSGGAVMTAWIEATKTTTGRTSADGQIKTDVKISFNKSDPAGYLARAGWVYQHNQTKATIWGWTLGYKFVDSFDEWLVLRVTPVRLRINESGVTQGAELCRFVEDFREKVG